MSALLQPAELEAALRAVGAERYHDKHPFHHMLHGGQLKKPQVQAWALNRYCYQSAVPRIEISLDKPFKLEGAGVDLGLTVEAFAVPGKVALYLEDKSSADFGSQAGDTIGLKITDPLDKKSFFYIPGCAAVDEKLAARLKGASIVFFDGTLFTDDEMLEQGLLNKTGARMGHTSMSGTSGSIAAFSKLGVGRLIYVHINNSNPALDENSPARKTVEGAGWEVGYDGMEVRL